MRNYFILVLNDGTDEIYNLNGLSFGTLEGFFKGMIKTFEPFEDLEDIKDTFESKKYSVQKPWKWRKCGIMSRRANPTEMEIQELKKLKFISYSKFMNWLLKELNKSK